MANSTNTSQLTELIAAQAQKEVYANANFRATSPSMAFARNDITTPATLTWNYYGGTVIVDRIPTQITNGTITNIPPNRTLGTMYLELGRVGTISTAINGIINKAATAALPVASHTFVEGDFGYINTTPTGMIEIQGTFFKVQAGTTSTSIVTDINSTSFTTHNTGTGLIYKVSQDIGTITIGKSHSIHTKMNKPLYSLATNASTISDWTDLRVPGDILFNSWGSYTPTLTNGTNIASSTPRLTRYSLVGGIVTVSGQLDITTTATGDSIIGISLPITAVLYSAYQLSGVSNAYSVAQTGAIYGQPTGQRAELRFQSINTSSNTMCFNFTYEI